MPPLIRKMTIYFTGGNVRRWTTFPQPGCIAGAFYRATKGNSTKLYMFFFCTSNKKGEREKVVRLRHVLTSLRPKSQKKMGTKREMCFFLPSEICFILPGKHFKISHLCWCSAAAVNISPLDRGRILIIFRPLRLGKASLAKKTYVIVDDSAHVDRRT